MLLQLGGTVLLSASLLSLPVARPQGMKNYGSTREAKQQYLQDLRLSVDRQRASRRPSPPRFPLDQPAPLRRLANTTHGAPHPSGPTPTSFRPWRRPRQLARPPPVFIKPRPVLDGGASRACGAARRARRYGMGGAWCEHGVVQAVCEQVRRPPPRSSSWPLLLVLLSRSSGRPDASGTRR